MKSRFIDQSKIFVAAGAGGGGCMSMRREKFIPRGGPDGGDGGHGGNVVLLATTGLSTLYPFSRARHFRAKSGENGTSKDCFGAGAEDLVIEVPLGTLVRTEEGRLIGDLVEEGQRLVVAKGGRGGRGNAKLITKANPLPTFAERGEPGEDLWIILELKLLADVGLVGLPNVGKSTLITRLTRVRPKVAAYPFTTLDPHLGVLVCGDDRSLVLADIPGLIEGAHEGKGLGIRFLKHIERTRLILHLIDVSGWERKDPIEDYRVVRRELTAHSEALGDIPELVIANKLDVPGSEDYLRQLSEALETEIHGISAITGEGIDDLKWLISDVVDSLPARPPPEPIVHYHEESAMFEIHQTEPGSYEVTGRRIENKILMTHLDNEHAVHVLQRKLKRMGLDGALKDKGLKNGDEVTIGNFVFEYHDENSDGG